MAARKLKVRQARRPDHSRARRTTIAVGLGALAVAAIALTAFAVSSHDGDEPSAAVPAPPTFEKPTPTPAPEPTPPPEAVPVVLAAPQRILSAGEEPGHLLRAPREACGVGTGTIEVSFDDGVTWQATAVTDQPGASVRQLDARDGTVTRATFLDAGCQPMSARSFTGGTAWEPDDTQVAIWALQADNGAVAWSPQGAVPLPCTAVSIAGESTRAIALCADASVSVTNDAGATWSQPTPVTGAQSVGMTPGGFIVAGLRNDAECVGVTTATWTAGTLTAHGGCIAGEFSAGSIAVSASAGTQYVCEAPRVSWGLGYLEPAPMGACSPT